MNMKLLEFVTPRSIYHNHRPPCMQKQSRGVDGTMTNFFFTMGPIPMKGGGGRYWTEELGGRFWITGGVEWRGHNQGWGGETSMIIFNDNKCPSNPFYCLFEWLFPIFLNACMLSFGVIMIRNTLFPLMFSHHCFRRPKSLFSLAWIIRSAVGST